MDCHHGTGRAQCWHLAVTCNVTVAIVKTIVIVAYLRYQSTQNYSQGFVIYMSGEKDTDRIFWLVLDAISCVTCLIYRSHRRRDHGSNFLTAITYNSQLNSKLYVLKKYVPTTQSNFSNVFRKIIHKCIYMYIVKKSILLSNCLNVHKI